MTASHQIFLAEDPQWSNVTVIKGTAPRARSLHAGVVLGDNFYIFGGYDGQNRCTDLCRFNFGNCEWQTVNVAEGFAPSPRDRHTAVATQSGTLIVFGGYDGQNRVNDMWEFNPVTSRWVEIPPNGSPPTPRHSHSAVEYHGNIFVFGGYDGNYRNDLYEFSTVRKTWSLVPTKGPAPRPRYRTSAVVHGNKLYIFGGHDGSKHLCDFFELDFETMTWQGVEVPKAAAPPAARDSHSSVVFGDQMIVFGGSSGSARNDLLEFDFKRRFWSELQSNGTIAVNSNGSSSPNSGATSTVNIPCPRFCHVGAVYRNFFYIFGGYDGQNRLGDFKRLTLSDPTKMEMPETTLATDLKKLVGCPNYSDVKFIVEEDEVFAHKILCARSPYFAVMFDGRMSEGNQKVVKIPGVSKRAFLKVLECVYSDDANLEFESDVKMTEESFDDQDASPRSSDELAFAMEVFVAADQFGVERLKRLCEQKIVFGVSVENAASILQAADVHNAAGLRSRCVDFILRHFDAVSKSRAFEEMAKNNVDLLLEILKKR